MLKSETLIILAVIIYVNRSHGWSSKEPKRLENWNHLKTMLVKNITGKLENDLIEFICDDEKNQIKSLENSTAAYLLTSKINTLTRWFKNSIAKDLNSTAEDILNSLTDVPDDLSTGDAYSETVKVTKTVLSDAAVRWRDDWNDAIREIKDMDPATVANSFSILNATLVVSLLIEDNIKKIIQYGDNKIKEIEKLLGPGKAFNDFREYETILKIIIEIDLKQKKVPFYVLLFDNINEKIDVKNEFEIKYRKLANLLKNVGEMWKTEWNVREQLEKRERLIKDLQSSKLDDLSYIQNISFHESTKNLLDYYSKMDKKFYKEFKAQYEQLKDLAIAAKTVIDCKIRSLQETKLQDLFDKRSQSLGRVQKIGESLSLTSFIQKIIEKFNKAIDDIAKESTRKLAIIWSRPRAIAFREFRQFFIHVNNEMLRVIESMDPNNLFLSFDDKEILEFF